MSQAYRYWEQIGWYPTYYCCLDTNINQNFARDIKNLVVNRRKNGIKKFFLSQAILAKYPKLGKLKGIVYFFEKLNKRTIKGFSGDSQITSGSFAVRFGYYLGYTRILLLGVDAHYKPIDRQWIKSMTDKKQRLIRTIDPEPDYFFAGYRKKGDYLHIPPKRRWARRYNHLQTFRKIQTDLNQGGKDPKVFIASKESLLSQSRILPHLEIPPELIMDHQVRKVDFVVSKLKNSSPRRSPKVGNLDKRAKLRRLAQKRRLVGKK